MKLEVFLTNAVGISIRYDVTYGYEYDYYYITILFGFFNIRIIKEIKHGM